MAKVEEDCIASIPLSRRLQTKTAATGLSITVDYTGARQPSMWSASDSTDDEHIVPARCRRPSSSSSQSSMSPVRVTFESAGSDEEDAWNLIPYNVPWGPSYFAYQAGTFPGPEGTSIFLRSPTPLKNQRTSQACKKCRERKAKCSGTRPSCNRCSARGQSCHYDEETKRSKRGTLDSRRSNENVATPSLQSNSVVHDPRAVDLSPLLQNLESFHTLSESPTDSSSIDLWQEEELEYPMASSMIDLPQSVRSSDFNSYPIHAPQPLRHDDTTSLLGGVDDVTFAQLLPPMHQESSTYYPYHQSTLSYPAEFQNEHLGSQSVGCGDFRSHYEPFASYSQPTESYSREYATYEIQDSIPRFKFVDPISQNYPLYPEDRSTYTHDGNVSLGYPPQSWTRA